MSIAKPQSLRLVDTISAGYRALNRHPWAALIPVGVSAYLWFGSPIALGATGRIGQSVRQAAALLGGSQPELLERVIRSDVRLSFAWLNLMPVFGPTAPSQGAIILDSSVELLAAFAVINLLTLLGSCLYLTLLGSAVSGEQVAPLPLLRRSLQVVGDTTLALLALLGVGLVISLPLLGISAIIVMAAPSAAVPVTLFWYIACFWAYVYTGFTPEAILIGRSSPLRAIHHSINVVRHNITGTLGLLLLSFVIANGIGVIWRQLAVSPLGVAAAILGSAYVGSGLSAARLEFYRDQITRWRG